MEPVPGESIRVDQHESVRSWLYFLAPPPIRRATFRRLWLGMGLSYAGDRLQQLAQAWLVATVTSSAMAVGAITAFGSLPMLFMPLGGVIADELDRRHLLIIGQLAGATLTAMVAVLVLTDLITVWHVYVWALANGVIWLVSRPAYKVILTESVPPAEVRSAVAINSMTETAAMVVTNGAGSILLGLVGLPIAFVLNTATYLVAAASLWSLRELGRLPTATRAGLAVRRVLSDLADGLVYLARTPGLAHPLLLTFVTIVAVSPATGLLAAIVHAEAGSIVDLGILAAAASMGTFAGAGFAGARSAGDHPTRLYAWFGMVAAVALALFASLPLGIASIVPLVAVGFVAFAEAVWNTSRVRAVADPAYQARAQAITSMAFTLGYPVGMLWGGLGVDHFGVRALLGGAMVLGVCPVVVAVLARHSVGTPE